MPYLSSILLKNKLGPAKVIHLEVERAISKLATRLAKQMLLLLNYCKERQKWLIRCLMEKNIINFLVHYAVLYYLGGLLVFFKNTAFSVNMAPAYMPTRKPVLSV